MTVRPENTAIARKDASKPLRDALGQKWITPGQTVLDFGCGRGADVRWLRDNGYDAEGFDAHAAFGWHQRLGGHFDVVLMIYVVNVLGTVDARSDALADAWSFVRPGGAMFVVSRERRVVEGEAVKGGWPRSGDGYWSNKRRGMFQRGHTVDELEVLVSSLGVARICRSPSRDYAAVFAHKPA